MCRCVCVCTCLYTVTCWHLGLLCIFLSVQAFFTKCCSYHWTVWSHLFLSEKLALYQHLNVMLHYMWRSHPELMHRASPTSNSKTVGPPTKGSLAPAIPSLSVEQSPSDTLPCINADSLRCLTVWDSWCKCLCMSCVTHTSHMMLMIFYHFIKYTTLL